MHYLNNLFLFTFSKCITPVKSEMNKTKESFFIAIMIEQKLLQKIILRVLYRFSTLYN